MDKVAQVANLQEKIQEEFKKQSEYLTQVESALKKLRKDKKITQLNIAKLEGAAQGYADAALLVRDMVKEAVAQGEMETA